MKAFTEVLVELRKKKDLKQKELADRIGLSRTYIAMLETQSASDKKRPSFEVLQKLCRVIATPNGDIDETAPLDPKKTFELVFSATRLDVENPFVDLGGPLESAYKEVASNVTKAIYVFSDLAFDGLSANVREDTFSLINRGVKYHFFSSNLGGCCRAKELFNKSIDAEIVKDRVRVYESDSLLCRLQIGICDPGERSETGFMLAGPPNHMWLCYLGPSQVSRVAVWLISSDNARNFNDLTPEFVIRGVGQVRLAFPKAT